MRILVVAPGRKTRGGITAVINAYEKTKTWQKYNCRWVETYNDRNAVYKLTYFLKSFIGYLFLLPFYDIVHIHFSWKVSAYRKMFFFVPAKMLGKKIILHLHSGAEPIIESKAFRLYEYLFKNADVNVFLAEAIKKQLEKHFTINTHKIIFNPSMIPVQYRAVKRNKLKPTILFAGTITEKKGTNDLLHAFGRIVNKYPHWKLVMAGNGEIEKGKEMAKILNIEDKVEFPGWVSGNAKEELFQSSSIFCLPSYTEGFPMSVLDAWAYGIPVITTPVGGLPDVIEHGINAMIFQPGNREELAENLELLMSTPKLRRKLNQASQHLSKKEFNIGAITRQLDELYSHKIS